jgi:hypothetical protein
MSDLVTVTGPNGLHMDVHKQIAEAFPDRFPLVVSKPKHDTGK